MPTTDEVSTGRLRASTNWTTVMYMRRMRYMCYIRYTRHMRYLRASTNWTTTFS